MSPILRIIGAASLAVAPAACSGGSQAAQDGVAEVVASAYPLVYAAEQVGGGCVRVQNLTPAGVEPHDLELTSGDIEAVADADLVLYLGQGFQPAVADAIAEAQGLTFDLLSGVDAAVPPPDDVDGGPSVDPHVWLDPGTFAEAIAPLAGVLSDAAPDAACDFDARGEALARRLEDLDARFSKGLAACEQTNLVTDHAAFGYLASAYELTQASISGLEPGVEPTPERLAQLTELVRDEGVSTIFTERLVSPEVAQALADEAGVDTAVLDTVEGLTPDQIGTGADYGSVMGENLTALRTALDCA